MCGCGDLTATAAASWAGAEVAIATGFDALLRCLPPDWLQLLVAAPPAGPPASVAARLLTPGLLPRALDHTHGRNWARPAQG